MRPHLATLVEDFRRHGAQTAVVVYRGNRSYRTSYGELTRLTGRFAAELARRQIGVGERVVVWGGNSAEWIAAFFGCLLRGAIAVPLDAAGAAGFAARVVAEVRPRLIVGDAGLLRQLADGGPSSAAPLRKTPLDEAARHEAALGDGGRCEAGRLAFADFAAALPAAPRFAVEPAVSAETPLQIVFTSGTTSEPKGVVHTHRNVLASLDPIEREMRKYLKYERVVHPLRFLHSLPLSHVFGQFMGLWVPPLLGAEVHFESQLDAPRLMATIHRERISVLAAVPRVLELLRSHLLVGDFRSGGESLAAELTAATGESAWKRWWRFRAVHRAFGWKFWAIVSGGASLPPELEAFWNRLGFALIQGYGLTETTALVTLNHPFKIGQGTIGKTLPGREVRLGEDGEIQVRGEMLSTASWQSGRLEPLREEWLKTGDLAAREASGELRFVGRKSDVIVSPSGMNIHAADLEAAMVKQPGVRGCAVVACASTLGMEPVAVVLFSGADEELAAAVRAANGELAEYQKIRQWLRWPEMNFPYTSTGKLLRRKVAEWGCAALAGQKAPAADSGGGDALAALIAAVAGERAPGDWSDDSLLSEDLHLDSLGRVQLQSELERRLGIELPDSAVAEVATLGELRALLGGTAEAGAGLGPGSGVGRGVDGTQTLASPAVFAAAPVAGAPMSPALPRSNGSERFPARARPVAGRQRDLAGAEQSYPHWPWWGSTRLLRVGFLEAVMRPLVRLLASPRVVRETGELPDGPLLLIANHVTAYDAALALYALPAKLRRRVAIAMSGEMLLDFRKGRGQGSFLLNALAPFAYWLIAALFNVFPLPRLSGFRRSFAHVGEALDRGYSVLIFPEGRRSEDGGLQPFRPGIGLLANESRVGVLPLALQGLGELKREGGRWFRSGRLAVHVGSVAPFDPDSEPGELTRRLEEAVRRLL